MGSQLACQEGLALFGVDRLLITYMDIYNGTGVC